MIHLIAILLLSTVSALVGFGFRRMQDPDMIFEWYRKWLEKLPIKKDPLWFTEFHHTNEYIKSKFIYYLTKPLGICIICNTTWIGMLLTFIFAPVIFEDSSLLVFDIIIVGIVSAGIVVMISNKYEQIQNTL
jgi:archaellum biogenesis protein FlaJ (TadC family)